MLRRKMMVMAMAAAMIGTMTGSVNVYAAKAGDSATGKTELADADFDTSYQPKKDSYKIYCTYKNIHSWYDAIKCGVDAAVADFAEKGVEIDYEWYGPAEPDAVDQVNSIETAIGQGYDLIAVDVNQPETTAKAVDEAVAAGIPVATFASSDIEDCDRSFFVGNTDNYGDGCALAKAVCEEMGGKGQIAILSGTMGAASHEERLQGFKDTIAEYPDIEIVDEQRDNDAVEKAISITESWLQAYPDLGGILCNNMSNPVGACQAVKDAGKSGDIVIGGMDHDLRTLEYLKDGTLFVAQNPLVNSLVMTAEKNKILFFCKILCHFLVKNLSLRGQINNPWLIPDLFFNRFIGKIHRLCLHQHSGAASIRIIVNLLMLIKCIVPDINCFDIQKTACHGPADNTGIHPVPDHVRKKRQYMKIHYISPFIKCMVITFFSRSTSRIHSLMAGRRTSPCSAESII